MKTSSKLTSKESFAILHEIENRQWDGKNEYTEWQKQIEK